jgi:hypothetical protein
MIDAVRMMRAALHGFVSIETAGVFGIPQSVDATTPAWWTPWTRPGRPGGVGPTIRTMRG